MTVKALFVAAYPDDSKLQLDEEFHAIQEAMQMSAHRGIELVPVLAARSDDLLQALSQHSPPDRAL